MNVTFIWDLDDDSSGNVEKLRQHGLTGDDAASVVESCDESEVETSASSGRPLVFGHTPDGRFVAVVFEWAGDYRETIYVVTAYEVAEP